MHLQTHHDRVVAVIGAGPGGLVAARWLAARGFEPVVFEAAARLGGQWNSDGAMSATWPGMRTNTSRVMTALSDLDHPEGTAVYPTQAEMLAYLERYAKDFGLTSCIRLRTRVELLSRAIGGWLIRSSQDGRRSEEVFARVVVASGRHTAGVTPSVPGLESFHGAHGVAHTAQYDGSARYRGSKILVAGCSISALEIATELAHGGAASVTAAYRKQRYILPKLIGGVPHEHAVFNRASALAAEVLPPEALAQGLKATVLRAGGSPEQWGAQSPDPDIFTAGISMSHGFLPAVAEGRIATRPWLDRVDGRTVHFADGSHRVFDGILFGTGYRLSLPWLALEIAHCVDLNATGMNLHAHTLHPDLPGLAFLGLYDLVGPYLPVLELQARWIAACFGGAIPSQDQLRQGVEIARAQRGGPTSIPMPNLAVAFARLLGAEPDLFAHPELERALLFGPLSPASFRLQGPDSLPDAAAQTRDAASMFGRITTPSFQPEEAQLRELILASAVAA